MSDSILHPLDFKIPTGPGSEAIPLARALKNHLPDFSWGQVRELCHTGKVTVDGDPVHDARRPVEPGMRIVVTPNAPSVVEPESSPRGPIHIYFEDSQVVVIEKPAGISTVPFEEGERNTVLDYVRRTWRALGSTDPRSPLMVVHRLDRDTSGVLVLAKTEPARAILASQFRSHVVEREYLAVVHGAVGSHRRTYHSFISSDRGDGLRGSVRPPLIGKEAITHVEVVEALNGATLVRCRLETGRTHQVRIHLSEAGNPIIGETVYIRDYPGTPLPFHRLALHAAKLGFKHPRTGRLVRFESPLPLELKELAREMGGAPDRAEVKQAAVEARVNRQHWANEVRDWWREGPEPGPAAAPARAERHERAPARPGRTPERGARAGTREQGAARGKSPRKEPTGWLEGGPEAPPMGKRPERAAPRFGRGAGESPILRPAARGDRNERSDRGDRSDRGERPMSASQGRRAQAIERVRSAGPERPDTHGEERSSGRAEERSSRAARNPLGGPEAPPRENAARGGVREGDRGDERGGERKPSSWREQGREPSGSRGGYRQSGDRDQGGERRGPPRREGGEHRGPPQREGFRNEGGEHRDPPQRGGDRSGPPQRGGERNGPPQRGGEHRGPPQREGFRNEGGDRSGPPPRRESGEHRGPPQRGGDRSGPPQRGGDRSGPPQRGGEHRGPPRREGGEHRDPQREGFRNEGGDRSGPPQRGGDRSGPPPRRESGEHRGPPRREGGDHRGPQREGFRNEGGDPRGPQRPEGFRNEGGDHRGPQREGFRNEGGDHRGPPRSEGFSSEGGDTRGPRPEGFGGEGGITPPRRQGFAGRGEERRDSQNREGAGGQGAERSTPPRSEGFAGRGEARRGFSRAGEERGDRPASGPDSGPRATRPPAASGDDTSSRPRRSEGPTGWSALEAADRPKARPAGARKKIRTEETDPKAAGKAQKKKLDALQNEISGLIDNAMKRK